MRNLIALCVVAKIEGYSFGVASSFRSYEHQGGSYSYWWNEKGAAYAMQYSARPGHSEHQLGTAVDFNRRDANLDPWVDTNVQDEDVIGHWNWLKDKAYKFGFVMTYPGLIEDYREDGSKVRGQDRVDMKRTGYKAEHWHYRFVGKAIAKKVYIEKLLLRNVLSYGL